MCPPVLNITAPLCSRKPFISDTLDSQPPRHHPPGAGPPPRRPFRRKLRLQPSRIPRTYIYVRVGSNFLPATSRCTQARAGDTVYVTATLRNGKSRVSPLCPPPPPPPPPPRDPLVRALVCLPLGQRLRARSAAAACYIRMHTQEESSLARRAARSYGQRLSPRRFITDYNTRALAARRRSSLREFERPTTTVCARDDDRFSVGLPGEPSSPGAMDCMYVFKVRQDAMTSGDNV